MLRPRLRSDRRICRIDFSAFVAVIISLLTLLIWAAPTGLPHHGTFIHLPQARHALELWDLRRDDALLISIARDGRTFLDTQSLTHEELTAKLLARLRGGAPRKVYIKADIHVHYRAVDSVLQSIQTAGFTNIAFLTEPQRPGSQ